MSCEYKTNGFLPLARLELSAETNAKNSLVVRIGYSLSQPAPSAN